MGMEGLNGESEVWSAVMLYELYALILWLWVSISFGRELSSAGHSDFEAKASSFAKYINSIPRSYPSVTVWTPTVYLPRPIPYFHLPRDITYPHHLPAPPAPSQRGKATNTYHISAISPQSHNHLSHRTPPPNHPHPPTPKRKKKKGALTSEKTSSPPPQPAPPP